MKFNSDFPPWKLFPLANSVGSEHHGGVNAAFGDGAIHFLDDTATNIKPLLTKFAGD